MIRKIGQVIVLTLIMMLTGCQNHEETPASPMASEKQNYVVSQTPTKDENILIAYFTWADNTQVANPNEVDVDTSTSASVLAPGNAAMLANWIQEKTKGTTFSIQVEDCYSSDYDECLDRAADEKAQNARPALVSKIENIDQYDTIFLGYPNWWYSCPMAVLSFIEEHDLSGKHIVLFCTHGTGGLGDSVNVIKEALPQDCSVNDHVLSVSREEVSHAKEDVFAWLEEIGY